MQLTFRRLTPELAQDYVHFFDSTLHDAIIPEHRCYCVCRASAPCRDADFSTAEKRRSAALDYIKRGFLQGYLAYDESERPIGWCSANTIGDCLQCVSRQRLLKDVPVTSDPVKSVFCFVIAPHMQRKGVASALLARVLEDAHAEGFCAVEAYPDPSQAGFSGPLTLYERAGLTVLHTINGKPVMQKSLH